MNANPEPLASDGRAVVVAIDHALYSYPLPGLEHRFRFIDAVRAAGVDGLILSYGTLRGYANHFGSVSPILKLDIARLGVGTEEDSEFRVCWTVENARKAGAGAVLTLVQLGTEWELNQLINAAKVAARAHENDMSFVLEALPTKSATFPDPFSAQAVAAAVRMAAELGAHVVKTNMPTDPEATREAASASVPVIFAGGVLRRDDQALLEATRRAVDAGASGVAFGRNVWGRSNPQAFLHQLIDAVHGANGGTSFR